MVCIHRRRSHIISVVTLAELRHGIERLSMGRRRLRLEEWLQHELLSLFDGRIISIDAAVGDAWGKVVARADKDGQPIQWMHSLLPLRNSINSQWSRAISEIFGSLPNQLSILGIIPEVLNSLGSIE